VREQPKGASIVAFRDHTLPLRGVVYDEFMAKALKHIADGEEYVFVETGPRGPEEDWVRHQTGDSHATLLDDLNDYRGASVALGSYPPFFEDGPHLLAAVVPDADGVVRPGPY
jgi:hypothetical protein